MKLISRAPGFILFTKDLDDRFMTGYFISPDFRIEGQTPPIDLNPIDIRRIPQTGGYLVSYSGHDTGLYLARLDSDARPFEQRIGIVCSSYKGTALDPFLYNTVTHNFLLTWTYWNRDLHTADLFAQGIRSVLDPTEPCH